jgi:hypothetical protein
MSFFQQAKYFVQQNTPNFILQPAMRWVNQWRYRNLAKLKRDERFTNIFESHSWGGDSVSGGGSDLHRTTEVRKYLPALIDRLSIKTFLDAPCGDFHWMQHVDLRSAHYIGGDIVKPIIDDNQKKYGSEHREFRTLDLVHDPLPAADLILVRDCFIHLCFADMVQAIANIKSSGSKYLLTTTYPTKRRHWDMATGGFRWVNLRLAPFNFPEPREMMLEEPERNLHDNKFADRSLGLWRISDIP